MNVLACPRKPAEAISYTRKDARVEAPTLKSRLVKWESALKSTEIVLSPECVELQLIFDSNAIAGSCMRSSNSSVNNTLK